MRALVRGFGWFVASLLIAGLVLRATVFDVWSVTELGDPTVAPLAPGDVVLVLRESKVAPGNLARCGGGATGAAPYAVRVPVEPSGATDRDDLPKPATIVTPRKSQGKRARVGAARPAKVVPPAVEAHAGLPAPVTNSDATCRRVVLRLWGEKGPLDPERRLTLLE
ncbi:MAG: hypothetical protein IPF92_16205 [Myxococcales bacterium]|jgi:hypothetical protein|nr:hypothetical protein [Myxococcales bacterium]MBL0195354.1 hypothetical protein [Myxococcales bacterium]HQY62728.1 hypothetical protein [Polyangiaceae bacterium]